MCDFVVISHTSYNGWVTGDTGWFHILSLVLEFESDARAHRVDKKYWKNWWYNEYDFVVLQNMWFANNNTIIFGV